MGTVLMAVCDSGADAPWFALTTKPRHKKTVASGLELCSVECFLPVTVQAILPRMKSASKVLVGGEMPQPSIAVGIYRTASTGAPTASGVQATRGKG
jgi:hypothetical protein